VYIGGSGSIKTTNNFDGIIDEIRSWGEYTTDDRFIKYAYDPGTYDGNTYTSAYTHLYGLLTFAQPSPSITSSIINESPYQYVNTIPSFTTYGFTTASYIRLSRTIRQDTPIVGSSIYTNKKINVAPPPVFTQTSLDSNGQKVLSRRNSIVAIPDKQYINSGKNIVSFAISPTDFINQNILRTMGPIDVNYTIGNPTDIFKTKYVELENLQNSYNQYYGETINSNQYIDFFKNVVEAPSEFAEEIIPARAKLLNGVTIQPTILQRNKIVLTQPLLVDGTDTRTLDNYLSGSLDTNVGAFYDEVVYDIQENITPVSYAVDYPTVPSMSWDSTDINVSIPEYVTIESSTPFNSLPSARKAVQYLNGTSLVSSSIFDDNSAVLGLDAFVNYTASANTVDTGYARFVFDKSGQVPNESNTIIPFYDIPPSSDFNDVGTTSYFHRTDGIYSYRVVSPYKTQYVVKLNPSINSSIDPIYAPITLLVTGSIASPPGRYTSKFTYSGTNISGSYVDTGVFKLANIFSLYGVSGPVGSRIQFYRDALSLSNDSNRTFETPPTGDHGILFDGILDSVSNVIPYVLMQTINSNVYYRITSPDTPVGVINMYYFAYEPINLTPLEYLPRHYKFSRENSTALKRRNYIGCLQTQGTTTDSNPPFQTFLSQGNTITVSSTVITGGGSGAITPITNGPIEFGGGGTLNVS
jgi:hypothetical protein